MPVPGDKDRDRPEGPERSGADTGDPIQALRKRLDRAIGARTGDRGRNAVGGSDAEDRKPDSALSIGFRIGTEFVSAVVVGVLLGWAIDQWAGTTPWAMIVLFLLGSAAGFLNVYRAVVRMGLMGGDGAGATDAARWPGKSADKGRAEPPGGKDDSRGGGA